MLYDALRNATITLSRTKAARYSAGYYPGRFLIKEDHPNCLVDRRSIQQASIAVLTERGSSINIESMTQYMRCRRPCSST